MPFKFVANEGTWEAGDNRTFNLQGPTQALPVLFFNNQTGIGTLSILREGAELRLNWTTTAVVRLQTASNLNGPWQDVPDATGLESITLPISGATGFFRLISP